MPTIDQTVTVNIVATSATPSLPGFGIPAIIGYHTHNTDLARHYTDLPSMVTDGFSEDEPLYLMAQSIVQQNPRPPEFVVIRGTTSVVQTFTFTVTDNNTGDSVGLTLLSPAGVSYDCHHTVASETTDQVATAVATLIDNLSGIAATATGSIVTATVGTSGLIWYPSALRGGNFSDTSPDASPDDDLTATLLVDDTWYGISGTWLDSTNIKSIAAWAQSNNRLHGYTSADSANKNGTSSGVMYDLKVLSRDHVYGLYSGTPSTYGATGWMANQFTAVPGSTNWAYKHIIGTPLDALTTNEQSNIDTNKGNFYVEYAGIDGETFYGKTSSGQYIDITVGIDSLKQKIQLRVATLLTTSPKLPYTRAGLAAVRGAVLAALAESRDEGFISGDAGFEAQCSVPDLANVSTSDKSNRILRNVTFSAVAQGAVNKVVINGTVSL